MTTANEENVAAVEISVTVDRPAYTGRLSTGPVPSLRLPDEAMEPPPPTASSTTN